MLPIISLCLFLELECWECCNTQKDCRLAFRWVLGCGLLGLEEKCWARDPESSRMDVGRQVECRRRVEWACKIEDIEMESLSPSSLLLLLYRISDDVGTFYLPSLFTSDTQIPPSHHLPPHLNFTESFLSLLERFRLWILSSRCYIQISSLESSKLWTERFWWVSSREETAPKIRFEISF